MPTQLECKIGTICAELIMRTQMAYEIRITYMPDPYANTVGM